MPTPNLIVRTPPDLRELAETRAKRDHCNVSDVARDALRAYLTGDDGGDALRRALLRAEAAEAKAERLEEELAAARQGLVLRDVAASAHARASARETKDDRIAAALQAATPEDPVTAVRLAAVSGFTAHWCRLFLAGLAKGGYAEKIRHGQWVPVPGRDIREGVRQARALAQYATAKVPPARRDKPGSAPSSPAPVRFQPAEES